MDSKTVLKLLQDLNQEHIIARYNSSSPQEQKDFITQFNKLDKVCRGGIRDYLQPLRCSNSLFVLDSGDVSGVRIHGLVLLHRDEPMGFILRKPDGGRHALHACHLRLRRRRAHLHLDHREVHLPPGQRRSHRNHRRGRVVTAISTPRQSGVAKSFFRL